MARVCDEGWKFLLIASYAVRWRQGGKDRQM
jgi:hypothetical protein